MFECLESRAFAIYSRVTSSTVGVVILFAMPCACTKK